MYHNFTGEECNYFISIIENKLVHVLDRYKYNYKIDSNFDFKQQLKIFSVVNACYEEINIEKGNVQSEFVKIASFCNAMSIFPLIKIKEDEHANRNINFDLILSVLFELTSNPIEKEEAYLSNCSKELQDEIINKISKIMRNPKISPYNLGNYLEEFYEYNKKRNKKIKIK